MTVIFIWEVNFSVYEGRMLVCILKATNKSDKLYSKEDRKAPMFSNSCVGHLQWIDTEVTTRENVNVQII